MHDYMIFILEAPNIRIKENMSPEIKINFRKSPILKWYHMMRKIKTSLYNHGEQIRISSDILQQQKSTSGFTLQKKRAHV